jgi:TRAP-type mannitol/chloroaromatic compound transport system substrate-binding protein
MQFSKTFKGLAVAGVAAAATLAMWGTADAQEKLRWKMASAFGSKLSILGPTATRFVGNVAALSGGNMQIKFFEPGALVPTLEIHDSVGKGALDSAWTTPGYHVGRIPALAFFTTVPFGPGATEYLGWLKFGGAGALYDEIYAGIGIKGLRCLGIAPEASGWFRKPIESVDDLKGLKMRFFGMGALVMNKIGVSTQLLAGADIYPALERGVIDATEFSMPSIDYDLGFYQIAKHYYFPGWHQQTSAGEFIMHKPKWDALSERQQTVIDISCGEALGWSVIRSDIIQAEAMRKLQAKGVTIHRWPDSFIDLLRVKWAEVLKENMDKDPLFNKVATDFLAFRKDYEIWKEHGYLN